jgi:NAD(P)-dependent dehydrogenase (short-subunit alcohol dehydrogenase family)
MCALAREFGELGITVSAVTPGMTQSETQVASSSGAQARTAQQDIELGTINSRTRRSSSSVGWCGGAHAYFRPAFTGSLTFATVANSIFQSSPFTFSTLRR